MSRKSSARMGVDENARYQRREIATHFEEGQEKGFIIPTRYKVQISSKLTWPLGAKELSESLVDVPQIEKFQLVFQVPFKMPQQGKWPGSFSVLKVEYNHPPFLSEHSDWTLSIHPVPRQIRAKVRESLSTQSLNSVVQWIAEHAEISGRGSYLRFELIWNCELEQLTFDSHDYVLPGVQSKGK